MALPEEELNLHRTWDLEVGGARVRNGSGLAMGREVVGLRVVGPHQEPGVGCVALCTISGELLLREGCCRYTENLDSEAQRWGLGSEVLHAIRNLAYVVAWGPSFHAYSQDELPVLLLCWGG